MSVLNLFMRRAMDNSRDYKLPKYINYRGRMCKVTYKSDKVDIEKEIRGSDEYYRVMTNWILADNWLFGEDGVINEAIDSNSFCVFQWKSASNGGKSWGAIQFALIMKRRWYERKGLVGRIEFSTSWGDTLDVFESMKAHVADHIICDEESDQSGDHAATDEKGMKNVLKACRAKGSSFSFNDPEPRPKPNVTAFIRIIGILKDVWVTWCVVFSPGGTPIGNLFLKVDGEFNLLGYDEEGYEIREYLNPEWADVMARYEPSKMENIDKMIENRGMVGSDIEGLKEKFSIKLYEYAQTRFETLGEKATKERLTDWLSKPEVGGTQLPNKTAKAVVIRTYDKIKAEGYTFRKTEKDKSGVEWRLQEIQRLPIDKSEFWDMIEKYLEVQRQVYNKSIRGTGKKALDKRVINWLKQWIIFDTSQQNIAENEKNVDQVEISRQTLLARKTILGYAVEDWLSAKYPEWEHVGGNSPDPDFVTNDERVISLKARCRANPQIEISDTARSERELALRENRLLQIYYFELKYDARLVIINCIPTSIKDNENDK